MKTNLLKTTIVAALIFLSGHLMAFTAVVSGSWSNAATWGGVGPGSSVSNQDIIIPTGITVDLDMDITFSGLLNSFTVDGTLNSASNSNVAITLGSFTGAGSVNVRRLSFDGLLTTATFSGNLNVHILQNQGAALTMAAATTVSDTLDLEGGSIILGTGANLGMLTNSSVRVNNGTLTTTGGVFTTGSPYDVWYIGTSKSTGLEVNSSSLRDLHVNMNDNTQVVTQGMNNITVNGVLNIAMGQYDFSNNHLTLNADLMMAAGTFIVSNATSDLTINGSGLLTGPTQFSTGSTINDIEIDRGGSGNVNLNSALTVNGTIFLTNGDFTLQSGSTLTMNPNSEFRIDNGDFVQNGGAFIGSAIYNVSYIGTSHTTALEIQGSGLNNVTVGLQSGSSTVTLDDDVTVNGLLDLQAGMLALDGNDLTLDGTFDQESVAVIVGDSSSTLTLNLATSTNDTLYFGGNMQYLESLELNIPATSSLLLASDLTIYDQLDMTSGKIRITNSNLRMRSTGTINGYDDAKYIVTDGTGQLEQYVVSNSTYVTYPIGTTTTYAPAYIQQNSSGTSGYFKVRTLSGVYSQGLTGFNSANTESVVNKTWAIDAPSVGTVNMNLKLGWKTTDENNGFNRNQAHIAHYMSNNWDTYMTGAAAGGAFSTYEIGRTNITSLSPFAVVDTAAVLGVHENTSLNASINVYPNPTVDAVTVETGALHANYLYEVFDATGKSVYSISNSNAVNKFDLSAFGTGFYFIKITNIETHATVTKRIVKS